MYKIIKTTQSRTIKDVVNTSTIILVDTSLWTGSYPFKVARGRELELNERVINSFEPSVLYVNDA